MFLRESLHQSSPPIATTIRITPIIKLMLNPPTGDSAAVSDGVAIGGDCVMDGCGEGVSVGGAGVSVGVVGGVMSSSNF